MELKGQLNSSDRENTIEEERGVGRGHSLLKIKGHKGSGRREGRRHGEEFKHLKSGFGRKSANSSVSYE